jgi:hypothetical protein
LGVVGSTAAHAPHAHQRARDDDERDVQGEEGRIAVLAFGRRTLRVRAEPSRCVCRPGLVPRQCRLVAGRPLDLCRGPDLVPGAVTSGVLELLQGPGGVLRGRASVGLGKGDVGRDGQPSSLP